MISPGLGMTIFGDLAYNIDGSDRRQAFIDGGGTVEQTMIKLS